MGRRPVTHTLPVRHPAEEVAPLSVYTGGPRRWQDTVFSILLIACAVVLLAAGASAIGLRLLHASNSPPTPPKVLALSALGVPRNNALALGSPISLAWLSRQPADVYRLQIVSIHQGVGSGAPSAYRAPILTVFTRQSSYTWRALGTGQYDWRVQAHARGVWGPFSAVRRLVVVPPVIALSIPLLPHNGSRLVRWVRLCWSQAQRAAGYYLWISGRHPFPVTGTCHALPFSAGSYTWRVAAYVQLPRRYVGQYSISAYFTIPAPAHVRRPTSTGRRVQTIRTRSVAGTLVPARPQPTSRPAVTPPARPASAHPAPGARPASAPVVLLPPPVQQPSTAPKKSTGCIPLYTC
jgi:hypothetical protein